MRRVLFLENYSIGSASFVLWVKVWSKTSNLYKTFHQQRIWDHEKLPKVWQGYFRRGRPGREKQLLPRHVNLNTICHFFLDVTFWTLRASLWMIFHCLKSCLLLILLWYYLLIFYLPHPKAKTSKKILVDYQLGPGVSPPLRPLPPLDGGKEDPVFRIEFTYLVSRRIKSVWLCYI